MATEADDTDGYFIKLLDRLTPGDALDVGCGRGRHSLPMLAKKWHVNAIDNNQAHLSRLCEKAQHSPFLHAETVDLHHRLPIQASDLVICSFVLHYFPLKRALEIIQALQTCLKPHGYLFLVAWSDQGELYETTKAAKHDVFFPDEDLFRQALEKLTPVEDVAKRTIGVMAEDKSARIVKNLALRGLWQKPP